jgi:hypothetical protein
MSGPPPSEPAEQQRIEFLEKKIQTKDQVLAELMAEHITLKKVLGSSEQGVGAARCAGPGGGFRPVLVRKDRHRRRAIHPLAGSDFWLEPWERQAIIGFHRNNPLEGYRYSCITGLLLLVRARKLTFYRSTAFIERDSESRSRAP